MLGEQSGNSNNPLESRLTKKPYEPERFQSPAYLAVLDDSSASTILQISDACRMQLRQQAEAGYPQEICGLLIGKITQQAWLIDQVRAVENLNRERAADRFQLDPAAYQAIDRELRETDSEIIGVYHSHPDCPAKPSPTDIENAWEGFAYPIISVCEGKVADIRCWSLNSEGTRFQPVTIESMS
jgi:proteasome lid subunit RPN8/RPN11